jgi:lipid-binding SYLF domain-containing protein
MRLLALMVTMCAPAVTFAAQTATERLQDATEVFSEVMNTPDKSIPQELLEKAQCVIIVPGMKKGAFVVGGEYGRGYVECRRKSDRGWGAPAGLKMTGGSLGFQIGGEGIDVVMLIMNDRGMSHLTKSKFTLGADASVAAGPVGRTASAQTDAYMNAEILAWSRSKGLFAGVALKGASVRPDEEANHELYGAKLGTREIAFGDMKAPEAAAGLVAVLNRYSMHKEGEAAREQK